MLVTSLSKSQIVFASVDDKSPAYHIVGRSRDERNEAVNNVNPCHAVIICFNISEISCVTFIGIRSSMIFLRVYIKVARLMTKLRLRLKTKERKVVLLLFFGKVKNVKGGVKNKTELKKKTRQSSYS